MHFFSFLVALFFVGISCVSAIPIRDAALHKEPRYLNLPEISVKRGIMLPGLEGRSDNGPQAGGNVITNEIESKINDIIAHLKDSNSKSSDPNLDARMEDLQSRDALFRLSRILDLLSSAAAEPTTQ